MIPLNQLNPGCSLFNKFYLSFRASPGLPPSRLHVQAGKSDLDPCTTTTCVRTRTRAKRRPFVLLQGQSVRFGGKKGVQSRAHRRRSSSFQGSKIRLYTARTAPEQPHLARPKIFTTPILSCVREVVVLLLRARAQFRVTLQACNEVRARPQTVALARTNLT